MAYERFDDLGAALAKAGLDESDEVDGAQRCSREMISSSVGLERIGAAFLAGGPKRPDAGAGMD